MSEPAAAPVEAPSQNAAAPAPAEAAPKTLSQLEAEISAYDSTPITSELHVQSVIWANIEALPDARLIDRESLKPLVEQWAKDLTGACPKHIREILKSRLNRSNPAAAHVFSKPDPLAPPAELPPFVPQTLGQQWLMDHYATRDANRPVWHRSVTPQAEFEAMVQRQREEAARAAAGYQPPAPPPPPPAPEGPQTLGQHWLAQHRAAQEAQGNQRQVAVWRQNR